MLINNIKVGYKLVGSIVLVCLMATGVILYGAKLRIELLHKMDSVHGKYEFEIQKIGDIKAALEKMRGDTYRYIYVPAERQTMVRSVNEIMGSINESMQAYKDRNIDAEEKKIVAAFDVAWSEMQRGYKEVMTMASEGKNNEVDRLLGAGSYVVQSREKTLAVILNLNEYINTKNKAIIKANMKSSGGLSGAMIILSAISVGFIIVLVILLGISITQPLKKGVVMMQELRKGHLSNRLGIKRKDEIGVLANAMDEFAEHLQNNVVFSMQRISEGDIKVQPAIIDEKDEIGPALKKMTETINNMVNEINLLTQSAMDGKLSVRGNADAFRGAYQNIIQGVNRTLDEVTSPINEASKALKDLSAKDMTVRMTGDYKGDFANIKESLNMAVENLDKALQQVAIGADQVASASVQVSTGGQTLSQGASEQASSLEEVSSSLQEMSSMTKQNALNAREANGVAMAASE
ncbi:MAG: MCP four helix bundle domain-containing protein, partial [Syntrophaceae bacterium]|nr:MCP four helix bundle domain-containing protein [Syntrophaceae bacterium]